MQELRDEGYKAWADLWHNASLLTLDFPEVEEHEAQAFDEWIQEMLPTWLDQIQEDIWEQFGFRLTLDMYGRSGATVAPVEFITAMGSDDYCNYGFDVKQVAEYYGHEGLDAYNYARKVLAVIKWLDKEVRERVKGLGKEWAYEKEQRREARLQETIELNRWFFSVN
jgi:hypothetical protein